MFSFWPFGKYLWLVQSWRINSFLHVRSHKNPRSSIPFKVCELHLTLNRSIQPCKVMHPPKHSTESDKVRRSISLNYTFLFNTEKKKMYIKQTHHDIVLIWCIPSLLRPAGKKSLSQIFRMPGLVGKLNYEALSMIAKSIRHFDIHVNEKIN